MERPDVKGDLAKELARLLKEWENLELNLNATQRDFIRLKSQIDSTCKALDGLDGDVR